MKQNRYALAINSILIVISSSIIGTILHEMAHYLTARYFGIDAELHHNYVISNSEQGTELQRVQVAAAGPIFSFAFGIILLYISNRFLKPSLLKLFTLWTAMGGILCFLGYILIAPIARQGDTGKVFDYIGISTIPSIAIAIISFVYINIIFANYSKFFFYYKNEAIFNLEENNLQLFQYPIFASILIMSLLNFPIVTWVSLLPTIFMPMTYFSTMGKYKKSGITDAELEINEISIPLIVLTVLSIGVFRYLV